MNDEEQILIEEEESLKNKFLTFFLDKESYGLEIKYVIEIIGIQDITKLPDMPVFIKGIINLRGETIPVMDMRLKFKMNQIEYGPRTCIIVVHIGDVKFGFIVDTVSEVIDIQDENIDPPISSKFTGRNKYILGIGKSNKKVHILLDVNKILNEEEINEIHNID